MIRALNCGIFILGFNLNKKIFFFFRKWTMERYKYQIAEINVKIVLNIIFLVVENNAVKFYKHI